MATFSVTGVNLQPMAGSHESLSVTTGAVVTLTATKYISKTLTGYPNPTEQKVLAEQAFITVVTNTVRWTVDGTTPTTGATGTGHDAAAGDVIVLDGHDAILSFKVIAATGTGTLKVTYFRN